jgi:hypothetical protein
MISPRAAAKLMILQGKSFFANTRNCLVTRKWWCLPHRPSGETRFEQLSVETAGDGAKLGISVENDVKDGGHRGEYQGEEGKR